MKKQPLGSPLIAGVAGLFAGIAALTVMVLLEPSEHEEYVDPAKSPAALEFLEAARLSSMGKWKTDVTATRTNLSGRSFAEEQLTVQRPPDQLLMSGPTAQLQRDGNRFVCDSLDGVTYKCQPAGPAQPWSEQVEQKVKRLEPYVLGTARLYDVKKAPKGCFDLRLIQVFVDPPYGNQARFCYDERNNHALVRVEIKSAEGTETSVADTVSTDVQDSDFDLPIATE